MRSLVLWFIKTILATIIVVVGIVVLSIEMLINRLYPLKHSLGDKFIRWRMQLNEIK